MQGRIMQPPLKRYNLPKGKLRGLMIKLLWLCFHHEKTTDYLPCLGDGPHVASRVSQCLLFFSKGGYDTGDGYSECG